MNDTAARDPLNAQPPVLADGAAARLARDLFGLQVSTVKVLTAERDLNLLLTADGGRFVMKVSNVAEAPEITAFQTDALCHLERSAPDLPVPRVLRTASGATAARVALDGGALHTMRILTYLDGTPLHLVPPSLEQRRNLAGCLARLDLALAGYTPAIRHEDIAWNIARFPHLEPLLGHLDDERRRLIPRVFAAFARDVAPRLGSLRRQVIYSDLNPHNVLADADDPDAISGIIDFGDMVCAPLVNDLAIAAAYQFGKEGGDTMAPVAAFISAYHAVLPLERIEVDLLPTLIATRLATTLLISGWRAVRYPENSAYILRNNPAALAALRTMSGMPEDGLREWARRCCGMET